VVVTVIEGVIASYPNPPVTSQECANWCANSYPTPPECLMPMPDPWQELECCMHNSSWWRCYRICMCQNESGVSYAACVARANSAWLYSVTQCLAAVIPVDF
jgi:hypothetical protein